MKNKAIYLLCTLLLLPEVVLSEQARVYGIVKGDDGKPVEFCVINAVNSNQSTYSNGEGQFSLIYNTDSVSSLIFYCLGYETKEVKIDSGVINVLLTRKNNMLNEVTIRVGMRRGAVKRGILGKKNLRPSGICTGHLGSERAIFLGADSTQHGKLKNIYFHIANEGIPDTRFRVHVYDIDTSYLPGIDLLDSNVVLHATTGNEWVGVDVSSRNISVGRGVFISMEWIVGYGNIETKVTSRTYTAQSAFNGQVLSFTQGYYKQGSLLYMKASPNASWQYSILAGSLKKNILNPMIYCTYTYEKK